MIHDLFDSVWDELSDHDACDASGSAEYRRLRRLWFAVELQELLFAWVYLRANEGDIPGECGEALVKLLAFGREKQSFIES